MQERETPPYLEGNLKRKIWENNLARSALERAQNTRPFAPSNVLTLPIYFTPKHYGEFIKYFVNNLSLELL